MKKGVSIIATSLVASTFLMVGCGSSCDQDTSVKYYNGKFVDSAVAGVSYSCGSKSGVTDSEGVFGPCVVGDPVSFSLGTILLGTVNDTTVFEDPTKTIITPTILAEASGDDEVAQKVAVTLQSFDEDGDPTNGITITEKTVEVVSQTYTTPVDLTDPEVTVADVETDVSEVVDKVVEETGNTAMDAKTADEAQAHLEETEKEIEEGTITPPEQPDDENGGITPPDDENGSITPPDDEDGSTGAVASN